MTNFQTSPRRRRNSASFAPMSMGVSGRRDKINSWKTLTALTIVPALLFLGHLAFGANHPVAALWLTALLALGLGAVVAMPAGRRCLHDMAPIAAVGTLFCATIVVAMWSLTEWGPGGAHPIWAWAGAPRGSITINRPATIIEVAKLLGLACIFVLGCIQSARSSWARATLRSVLLLGAGYGVLSLIKLGTATQMVAQTGRLSGGFLSANSAATVFGMLTVLGLAALLRDWRQARGLDPASKLGGVALALSCVLLSVTCLLLTASRMGAVATLVGAAVLMAWEMLDAKRERMPLLIAGTILLLIGLVAGFAGNDLLWNRIDTVSADQVTRGSIFAAHWRAFLASPLLGYGLGSFADVNSQLIDAQNYDALWVIRATHNVYLQWLEEAGIVGSAPMFATIAAIIISSVWRSFSVRKGKTLLRGLIAMSVVVLVHGTVDFALQVPSIAAFWSFILGCQFNFARR